jgi:hypothetical protein
MSKQMIGDMGLLVAAIHAGTITLIALVSVFSRNQSRRLDAHTTLRLLLRRRDR